MPIYAKLNASMPWHDKVAELSDGAFRAYVKVICAAKQRENPEFSRQALLASLGEHQRYVRTLTQARLLDVIESKRGRNGADVPSRFVVHDYEEHQSSDRYDPTAVRRNREYRARLRSQNGTSAHVDDSGDNGSDTSRRDVSITLADDGARAEQNRTGKGSSDKKLSYPPASDDIPDDSASFSIDPDHPLIVYRHVTGWPASPKQEEVLNDMVRDHTAAWIVDGMRSIGRPDRGEDFFGKLRDYCIARRLAVDETYVKAQAERAAREIAAEHERVAELTKALTPEVLAERRAQIDAFTKGFGNGGRARLGSNRS